MLVLSCGKVVDPRPPFIRIPEGIRDLTATQDGYNVVLTWTNPAVNIDGSPATDLSVLHITSDAGLDANIPATGAGQRQSYSISALEWVGTRRSFNVTAETTRGKLSASAGVNIIPVDVPSGVRELEGFADQYTLNLKWLPPAQNPNLAHGYLVQRTDSREPPRIIRESQLKDSDFEIGREYVYEVVPARNLAANWIRGTDPRTVRVTANDKTPPKAPEGVQIVVTDTGAIITWTANDELDLAGYRVFRGDRLLNPQALRTTNSFIDSEYRPGASYSLSAVDEFGNVSQRSIPK